MDGRILKSSQGEDVVAIPTTGTHEPETVVSTPGDDQLGAVSPDGNWIAANSDESEGNKVYVRPFRAPGGRFLISTGHASAPLWVSNTATVYQDVDANSMVSADLQLGTTRSGEKANAPVRSWPLFGQKPVVVELRRGTRRERVPAGAPRSKYSRLHATPSPTWPPNLC